MKRHTSYKLSEFIELAQPTDAVIDHIILTKHDYLLIYQGETEYLISSESYIPGSFSHNYETGFSMLKQSIKMMNIQLIVLMR